MGDGAKRTRRFPWDEELEALDMTELSMVRAAKRYRQARDGWEVIGRGDRSMGNRAGHYRSQICRPASLCVGRMLRQSRRAERFAPSPATSFCCLSGLESAERNRESYVNGESTADPAFGDRESR